MQKIKIHFIRFLATGLALLIVSAATWASADTKQKESSSIKVDTGVLERDPMMSSLDMLGITRMECNCSFVHDENEQMWLFQSEPLIRAVDSDGPSGGKLKDGDVIVAVDGVLITTRKGGSSFSRLEAGKIVAFTVRRAGRIEEVTVVPQVSVGRAKSTLRPVIVSTAPAAGDPVRVSELSRSIEALSRRSAEMSATLGEIGGLEVPRIPEFPKFPEINIDFSNMLPKGWVGFKLSFSGSVKHKDESKSAEWRFNEPPTINSIQPGSPADSAGLQPGDELLTIDGLKLDSKKGGKRFSALLPGQVVEWKVKRGAKTFTVETETGVRPPRESLVPLAPLPVMPVPVGSQPVRYVGALGDTEIEVRGGENVRVEVDEKTGEIVIRSGDSVVRLKPKQK